VERLLGAPKFYSPECLEGKFSEVREGAFLSLAIF
jgi:hypothetical protein